MRMCARWEKPQAFIREMQFDNPISVSSLSSSLPGPLFFSSLKIKLLDFIAFLLHFVIAGCVSIKKQTNK